MTEHGDIGSIETNYNLLVVIEHGVFELEALFLFFFNWAMFNLKFDCGSNMFLLIKLQFKSITIIHHLLLGQISID